MDSLARQGLPEYVKAAPEKRKPGRPRKVRPEADMADVLAMAEAAIEAEAPVRKRGRPRKVEAEAPVVRKPVKGRKAGGVLAPYPDQESVARFLSQPARFEIFTCWIVGDSPLICHAWSEKARREMLATQTKATKAGREVRKPDLEFESSLYKLPNTNPQAYGFPATAIKRCILSAAHKDKGIARETVMRSLWINAPFVNVNTAFQGAVCDLPLVRLYGTPPVMRDDMVRIGAGLNKTANLAWRAQLTHWAIKITGRFNASVLSYATIQTLMIDSGLSCGIGDWRNEKGGQFGSFHVALADEAKAWEGFVSRGCRGVVPGSDAEALPAFVTDGAAPKKRRRRKGKGRH